MQAALSSNGARLSRLTVFAFIWGNIRVFHQLSFPNWLEGRDPRDWGLFLLGLLVMAFPQWLPSLILLLGVSLLHTIAWMPFNPNHILFEFFSDVAILGGILYSVTRRGLWGSIARPLAYEEAEGIFDDFAPAARINILLLYFFVVLHKINWDFLDPEHGCGKVLLQGEVNYWLEGLTLPYPLKVLATYGTLATEAGIPLLFLFRRTRPLGVLVGLLFHFTLSLHPHGGIFSFTGLVYSYFFLFLTPGFTLRLGHVLRERFMPARSSNPGKAWITILGWAGFLIGLFLYGFLRHDQGSYEFSLGGEFQISHGNRFPAVFMGAFWMFLGWCILIIFLFLAAGGLHPASAEPAYRWFTPKPALLLIMSVVILLNGFSPYLGWKTHTSLSMFSNIRTEGGINNHVFMPRAASPWQDDLVTVVSTDAKTLKPYLYPGLQLVYFEFRHLTAAQKGDFYVDYVQNGQALRFVRKGSILTGDADLNKPHPWLQRKALRFRPVYPRPCPCQH